MPNWKSVKSINLKSNSYVMSSLEMAFAWIFIRFKPLLIRLFQLVFEMSNVFFGFANFHRCFIAHYFLIVVFLILLIRNDQPFFWGVEVNNAFQSLKVLFMNTPLLIHVDPSKPFVLNMNAFDFIICIILSQLEENNLLHFVDFCSCKYFHAKINYEIYDKKLIAIIDAFKEWCHLLKGAQWRTPNSLRDSNVNPKQKTSEE